MGFLSDVVHGKEKKIKADPLAGGINSTAQSGIGMLQSGANELNNKIYSNAENYIDNQIGAENMALRSAADDATRRTRELIARRGMGGSSIGLGQEANQARGLNERLALNNVSGMDRLKGLLNEKMQTGNQLLAPKLGQGPLQMADTKYRTGGYGELLVGAGKAYASSGASLGK